MDNNFKSIADTSGVVINDDNICPANPLDYDDILKFSNAHNCTVNGSYICGGKEDAVDMNRNCQDIVLNHCTISINGKQGFTIKGGCFDIVLNSVVFYGKASNVEIELGNYSEQSDAAPRNIVLNDVCRFDDQPVVVRLLNCDEKEVHVNGGNVIVYKPWWVKIGLFKLYCYLRKKNIIK